MTRALHALVLACLMAVVGGADAAEAAADGEHETRSGQAVTLHRQSLSTGGRLWSTLSGHGATAWGEAQEPRGAVRTAEPDGPWHPAAWAWPLDGQPPVVHRFDPPEQRWLPGHRGIDLAGLVGQPVRAVDDGVVTYSGTIAGVGILTVTHDGGLRSTYQPVDVRLPDGTSIARGEVIGVLADLGSHCLVRTCLHLGAIRGKERYVDPLLLLSRWQLSLLPLEQG